MTVERVTRSAIPTLGHSRDFRRLSIGAAALSLATVSDGFLYLVLQRDVGMDATVLPLMFAGTAVCYFMSAVPLGRAADRFGRRPVFLCGYIFLLLAYGVVLSRVAPMLQIVAVLALLGAYYGATDGVLAALASAVLPASLRGTGLALLTTGITLARLVGSVLFGYLWTATTARSALQLFTGGLVTCLVLAAFTLSTGRQESRA
jgi:MFS family permease